jgi:hypothetical protein
MIACCTGFWSEIEEDTLESDGHKILYSGNALEVFDKTKVQIEYLESWFDIIASMISRNGLEELDRKIK